VHVRVEGTGAQHLKAVFDVQLVTVYLEVDIGGHQQAVGGSTHQHGFTEGVPLLDELKLGQDVAGNEQAVVGACD